MKAETFTFTSKADGTAIACYRWHPEESVRGIVQIAHGMAEHGARYGRFAEALCGAKLAVYANDHRGHGRTASVSSLGDFGTVGWDGLVADVVQLTELIRADNPGKPVVLFGHSMGSFAAQQFVLDHSALLDGLILSGSSAVDQLAALAASGADVSFSAFNEPFAPARTDFDWLSRDPKEVDAYVKDPLCGFQVADASMLSLMMAGERLGNAAAIGGIRKDLPVLVFSGSMDPVHGGKALLDLLVQRYTQAGIADLEFKYYEDGRHEMLNETNREEVTADILAWLDKRLLP